MIIIKSPKNKIIKEIRSIIKGRVKNKFIVEGEKVVSNIPKNVNIEAYVLSKSSHMVYNVNTTGPVYVICDTLMASISDTITSQGVMAICNRLVHSLDNLPVAPSYFALMLDGIGDPGNMGTILRTAHACGVNFVLTTKGTVDVYNNKVLRSTAGAVFGLPIVEGLSPARAISFLGERGICLVSTSVKGEVFHHQSQLDKSLCLVIGNEARGVCKEILLHSNQTIKIPMVNMESLNASVAAGILLYEVARQKNIF